MFTRKGKPDIIQVGIAVGFLKAQKEFKGCFEVDYLGWFYQRESFKKKGLSRNHHSLLPHTVNSITNGVCRKCVDFFEIPLKKNWGLCNIDTCNSDKILFGDK